MLFEFFLLVSSELCDEIAVLRRKIQNAGVEHVLFLDETAMRVNEAPTNTIVLPGESAYVVVDETTAYAKRFDMIACCTGKAKSCCYRLFTHQQQEYKLVRVKGINSTVKC